jgi:heme/copper-type cytochrome/quinol oxidase subunit 2
VMRRSGQSATIVTAAVLWLAGLALPRLAAACATCFGDPQAPATQGMNNAILFLLGIVGVVYVGVGKLFWDFRKRSKRLEEQRPMRQRLHLIHGGKH